jgi:hypothetical protein
MKICNSLTETVGSVTSLWLIADKVPSAGTSHLLYFVSFFVCVCVCVCVEVNSPKNVSFIFEGHNDGAEIVQQ